MDLITFLNKLEPTVIIILSISIIFLIFGIFFILKKSRFMLKIGKVVLGFPKHINIEEYKNIVEQITYIKTNVVKTQVNVANDHLKTLGRIFEDDFIHRLSEKGIPNDKINDARIYYELILEKVFKTNTELFTISLIVNGIEDLMGYEWQHWKIRKTELYYSNALSCFNDYFNKNIFMIDYNTWVSEIPYDVEKSFHKTMETIFDQCRDISVKRYSEIKNLEILLNKIKMECK